MKIFLTRDAANCSRIQLWVGLAEQPEKQNGVYRSDQSAYLVFDCSILSKTLAFERLQPGDLWEFDTAATTPPVAAEKEYIPEHITEMARQEAGRCWTDATTSDRVMDVALADAFARRLAVWINTARQYATNTDFYRNIVQECGELFGEAARTADDGSVQDSVLALKVVELVRSAVEKARAAEKENAREIYRVAAQLLAGFYAGKLYTTEREEQLLRQAVDNAEDLLRLCSLPAATAQTARAVPAAPLQFFQTLQENPTLKVEFSIANADPKYGPLLMVFTRGDQRGMQAHDLQAFIGASPDDAWRRLGFGLQQGVSSFDAVSAAEREVVCRSEICCQ